MPIADIGFIGISRDEETFEPKPYVNKLPESLAGRPVIVIDPMLATGGSLVAHDRTARRARCARRRSPSSARSPHPRASSACATRASTSTSSPAAIDDHLNDNAFIVPGLGDAGDRQFGSGG